MEQIIISKILDFALSILKKTLPEIKNWFTTKNDELENSIQNHLKKVEQWSSSINFSEVMSSKITSKIVIDTLLDFTPKKYKLEKRVTQVIKLSELFKQRNNFVILGDPGAGKTTALKYLAQTLIHKEPTSYNKMYSFPILIKLREYEKFKSLHYCLAEILGIINVNISVEENVLRKVINCLIDNLGVVILIDGLDEIKHENQLEVMKNFRQLVVETTNCRYFLTCRSGEFDYSIDNCEILELVGFNQSQIIEFSKKWFKNKMKAEKFVNEINKVPYYDSLSRPLILANICAIYEKYNYIPAKPKTIYKKIISLLLEEWDRQRSIMRVSIYTKMEPDRKMEFLSHFAYQLSSNFTRMTYDTSTFMMAYNDICNNYGLSKREVSKVIAEIESHTGILVKVGYDKFEFVHKSLQEYLCAEYMIRLPHPTADLYHLPNETAIAMSLSSDPTLFFIIINFELSKAELLEWNSLKIFISRVSIEKPDFRVEPLLGISFLILYSMCLVHLNKGERNENFDNILQLKMQLLNLYKYTNIFESVRSGKIFYVSNLLFNNEIKLVLSEISAKKIVSYGKSFELPDQLLVDKELEL